MTRIPDHDPTFADRAASPSGVGAAREFGADLVAAVNLDAIDAQLAQWPAASLLRELESIVVAIESVDPARQRRRVGFLGRLLGRDLVAQAQPDPALTRVRLGLANAQAQADELRARSAELERSSATIRQQIDRLGIAIADERAALTASAVVETATSESSFARQRRLDHLEAIAASWRASLAHIALVRSHAAQLLARHAQVRDLTVSLWREQTSATAASAELDHSGIARLHAALRDLATGITPVSSVPHDPPTKEPSP